VWKITSKIKRRKKIEGLSRLRLRSQPYSQVKKTSECGGLPDCKGLWTRKFSCGPELCKEVQEEEDQEDQENWKSQFKQEKRKQPSRKPQFWCIDALKRKKSTI
jgi:hypothetical protein